MKIAAIVEEQTNSEYNDYFHRVVHVFSKLDNVDHNEALKAVSDNRAIVEHQFQRNTPIRKTAEIIVKLKNVFVPEGTKLNEDVFSRIQNQNVAVANIAYKIFILTNKEAKDQAAETQTPIDKDTFLQIAKDKIDSFAHQIEQVVQAMHEEEAKGQ